MPNSAFTYDMIQREGELGLSFRTVFPQVPVVQPENGWDQPFNFCRVRSLEK